MGRIGSQAGAQRCPEVPSPACLGTALILDPHKQTLLVTHTQTRAEPGSRGFRPPVSGATQWGAWHE